MIDRLRLNIEVRLRTGPLITIRKSYSDNSSLQFRPDSIMEISILSLRKDTGHDRFRIYYVVPDSDRPS